MKVLFSHGKESGPWGTKIRVLAEIAAQMGLDVDSIDYTDLPDPDRRVERLYERLEGESERVLLVGSSMGGYVSLVCSNHHRVAGVFLLAPALYIEGFQRQHYPSGDSVIMVHGWSDEVIPYQNSIRYACEAGAVLHLIPGDHRLNSSMERIQPLFMDFLSDRLSS